MSTPFCFMILLNFSLLLLFLGLELDFVLDFLAFLDLFLLFGPIEPFLDLFAFVEGELALT